MHWKKVMNPPYLGGWDFEPKEERVLKIESIKVESVTGSSGITKDCNVLYFNQGKPMVLNTVNSKALAKLTGSNQIEDWVGQDITLYTVKEKAFGDVVDALRIRPYKPKPVVKPELDKDRFDKALEAVKAGSYTKEQMLANYTLTVQQVAELNKI